jgi:hypothetical protein
LDHLRSPALAVTFGAAKAVTFGAAKAVTFGAAKAVNLNSNIIQNKRFILI